MSINVAFEIAYSRSKKGHQAVAFASAYRLRGEDLLVAIA
jgi:hypothetical protein